MLARSDCERAAYSFGMGEGGKYILPVNDTDQRRNKSCCCGGAHKICTHTEDEVLGIPFRLGLRNGALFSCDLRAGGQWEVRFGSHL